MGLKGWSPPNFCQLWILVRWSHCTYWDTTAAKDRQRSLFDYGIKVRERSVSESATSSSYTMEESESETASMSETLSDATTSVAMCTQQVGVSHEANCGSVCCQPGSTGPNQPTDRAVLNKTQRVVGAQNRSVNSDWFGRYKWLILCERWSVLFCYSYIQANWQKLITFSKKSDDAFITAGFSGWKNALTRFAKHESSDTHREAVTQLHNISTVNSC